MRHPAVSALLARYAVAWAYVVAVTAAGLTCTLLPGRDQAAILRFASTNVHNLSHDPVGCLVASAFVPSGSVGAWPLLIALAMFGAVQALGNWRAAAVCAAGHVVGTLVSEGIVAYRVAHGTLPGAARYIVDVGPSYVVVTAIAVAVLCGGWLARGAALADLALLVFAGDIFSGLSRLDVAAVGHTTALAVGVVAGGLTIWLRRPDQAGAAGAAGADAPLAEGRRAEDQAAQPRPPA
jgi:hypothetical protein